MDFLADQVLCFYICQKESKATGSDFYVNHKKKKPEFSPEFPKIWNPV